MKERIALQLGASPWQPSRSVRMVRELNFYDVPTEGVLRRRFSPSYYFFACIDGVASEYSLWVYAPIGWSEARQLKRLETTKLRSFEVGLLVNRPLLAVVASEQGGILHRVQVQVTEPLKVEEPRLAKTAWETVTQEIKAEAGAIERMAFC
ncbi:hypothetical protein ACFVAG_21970 [Streptomyces sp. NPDC057644]|uniref:hypothetical protein n=1 Tax=Streptomyces sp. NPDC057644 TaxID=3346191 RepID=UPI0036B223E5